MSGPRSRCKWVALTLPETNITPEHWTIFQPLIFRGYVGLKEGLKGYIIFENFEIETLIFYLTSFHVILLDDFC